MLILVQIIVYKMKKNLAISLLFLGLSCTSNFAFAPHNFCLNTMTKLLAEANRIYSDTVFIDLKNDPDFRFKNNLMWFQDNEQALFGIKNTAGDIYIEPLFYQIESFVEGISIVSFEDFQGAINNKGELVIPHVYEELHTCSEGMIAFKEADKWGFLNTSGDRVIGARYDFVGSFSEGLALASQDNLFGYINRKGDVVIPFQYDYAGSFEGGEAQVEIEFRSFIINKKGKIISEQ